MDSSTSHTEMLLKLRSLTVEEGLKGNSSLGNRRQRTLIQVETGPKRHILSLTHASEE